MGRNIIKATIQTFYYSRKKLGLYLLFNLLLLALAVIFTLTVFPEYPVVYYFAIGSCLLSVISSFIVFIVPLPLAVITPESIKIDRAAPLPWKSVRSIRKIKLGKGIFSKSILRLTPRSLGSYRLNFMQKISAKSEFGSFSIPLYAMNNKDAQRIEKEIHAHLCQTKTQTRLAKGKKEAKKKKIFNSTPSVKRKTKKVKDKK